MAAGQARACSATTRQAFLDHERAKSELKALMPEDAKEAIRPWDPWKARALRTPIGIAAFPRFEWASSLFLRCIFSGHWRLRNVVHAIASMLRHRTTMWLGLVRILLTIRLLFCL
jgi:hypothetical protein